MVMSENQTYPREWKGYCPVCEADVTFRAYGDWYRDQLLCLSCEGHSIPRERSLMAVLSSERPNWRNLAIHESSPSPRAVSAKLARECRNYLASQLFSDVPLGDIKDGVHCQDLERQTFPDGCFDVVISQDVMEHVFDLTAAHREIWRTLMPGGLHIFTTPVAATCIVRQNAQSGMALASNTCFRRTTTAIPLTRAARW